MNRRKTLLLSLAAVLLSCSQGVPPKGVGVPDDHAGEPDGPVGTDTPDEPPPCRPPATVDAPTWYHTAVGYEIFVRSFRDSDGDGVGDFAGIIEKLDYLNDGVPGAGDDLEVDLIWLTPIHPSPSDHGYDVIDYREVNADFGGMEAFDTFLEAAHARGIRVVMDLVVNHSSSQHPWFQASAAGTGHDDWYVWSDAARDWKRPWGGGPTWHEAGGRWYYGLFWTGMPDLNYTTEAVTEEMIDIARFWLEKGLDGFRLDAVRYLVETGKGDGQSDTPETLAWWRTFTAAARTVRDDVLLVGEAWTSNETAALYHGDGDGLPMTFDFDLSGAILGAVKGSDGTDIENVLCRFGSQFPEGAADGIFLTNHDMVRVASELGEEPDAARLAAGLLFSMPGTPWMYYGEEIGMRNGSSLKDQHKRKPMQWTGDPGGGFTAGTPWEPLHPQADTINVADQSQDPDSLLSLYRDLIRARRARPALHRGGAEVVDVNSPTTDEVWALRRAAGDDAVVCAFNLGESTALAVNLAAGDASGAEDALTGESVVVSGGVVEVGDLGPRAFRYVRLLP
ncbi:MAG: alpha-amylase family glycosyl hydrolase [Pseudomonadota bacterium]